VTVKIGIASLLTGVERDEVLRFWDVFEKDYNSIGVRSFDHPNLGFQGGGSSNIDILKAELVNLCNNITPFEVIVDGFGYFEAPSKVVYLQVRKTNQLIEIHKEINRFLSKNCISTFQLYTPEYWVPHITLAMDDLSETSFDTFKNKQKNYSLTFNQKISNLALVEFKDNGVVELLQSYEIK
jgi:2'-5' RNA ligase